VSKWNSVVPRHWTNGADMLPNPRYLALYIKLDTTAVGVAWELDRLWPKDSSRAKKRFRGLSWKEEQEKANPNQHP